jgi:hypothetical protein
MPFQIEQIFYWLALSIWFGGVFSIALAAPIVFRTVRESNPVLTNVLSVNLEGQHATLLAGSIVGNLLARLARIELLCAGVLLLAMVAQFFLIDLGGNNRNAATLRWCLYLTALAIVIYDWRVVWPRITRFRDQYIEHADEPDIANPAKEQFDHEHHRSVMLLTVRLGLLLGLIVFSSNIMPEKVAKPIETAGSMRR